MILCALLVGLNANAQCLELYDGQGILTDQPYWVSCTGGDYTLNIQSTWNIGQYSIDWGDGSPITTGNSLVPPAMVSHLYPAVVDTFVVTFTELNTGCIITGVVVMEEFVSASIQIPVNTLTQVCAPEAIQFTNSSTDVSPTTTFTWDFGDMSNVAVYDHTNWGQTISHTYQQGTVSCETFVTLSAENYCTQLAGGPSVATFNPLRVWDIDTAVISASATLLCYPDTVVDFVNTSIRNCINQGNIAQRYEYWNFGDYWGTGHDSIIDWAPWPPPPVHTIAYPGIGTYNVMMLDSNFCGIDTAYITIEIVPPPSVMLSVNPDTVCVGESVFLDQTTFGGANAFFWDFDEGNGFQATGAGDRWYTFSTPGDHFVQYSAIINGATAGCADTAGAPVVVIPSPTAILTQSDTSACGPLAVQFGDASIDAITHEWNFGNGNTSNSANPPVQNYTGVANYDISLVVTNNQGCTDTTGAQVNIFDPPVVNLSDVNICLSDSLILSPPVTMSPGDNVVNYYWETGDGTIITDSVMAHMYSAPGVYQLVLVVDGIHCSNSDTATVTVAFPPTSVFSADTTMGCSPLSVQFTNGSAAVTNNQWFVDGVFIGSAVDTSYTFQNNGANDLVHTVSLAVSDGGGCVDTSSIQVTVHPEVRADFDYTTSMGCAPLDVQLQNTSSNATNYNWDFGDGNTSTQFAPQHTYINNTLVLQVFTITLIATDSITGCSDIYTRDVQVFPVADFTFNAVPDTGCSPLTVDFPVVLGAVSYEWDFGDGSIGSGAPMQHVFYNSDTIAVQYDVTLVTSNAFGCTDSVMQHVVVYPSPSAEFIITQPIQQIPNNTFAISNTGSNGTQYSYYWDFGNGTNSSNPFPGSVTYATAGNYTVSLIVSNAFCADTASDFAQLIDPDPVPSFTGSGEGCSPVLVEFQNTTMGATSFMWQFGDGNTSTLENPSHLYVLPGTYFPSLTTTGFGGQTQTTVSTDSVVVYPNAIANFTAQPNYVVAPDDAVYFYNLSSNADIFWWDLGDGNTSIVEHPVHYYQQEGQYDVTLIANNAYNCPDTFLMINAVLAESAGGLDFPNAFTPSSGGQTDGVYDPNSFDNDFFFPIYQGVVDYHLQVFNRWGEMVFESRDVKVGWDGYYRGQPAKQDVYVWKAFAKFSNGNQVTKSGDLTLLR